jgi:hypothetical protein
MGSWRHFCKCVSSVTFTAVQFEIWGSMWMMSLVEIPSVWRDWCTKQNTSLLQCPLHKFPEGDLATFCLAQGHLNFRDLVWCTCVISFVISGNHQVSIATRPAYQKWSSTQWNNESSQLQAEQSWTWRSMHIPQDTYATSVSVRLLEHVRTKYDKHLLFYWRRRIIVAPKRHCPRFEDCRSQCSLNKAEQNAEYADFNTTPFSTLKKPSKDL